MTVATSSHHTSSVHSTSAVGLAVVFSLVIASCGGGGSSKDAPAGSNAPTTPPTTPSNPTPPVTPGGSSLVFGVQTHFGQGWPVTLVSRVAAANITNVRDELYWEIVEPTPGNYTFPAAFESYMGALRDQGITPLVELDFENHNYDGGNTPYTDAGFNAYARYAVAVLRHYGTQIKAVEVWNEYNGSFAKGPATNDRAGTYVKMLKAAYTAIKAERPDVTVVGASTAGVPLPYLESLFAAGALNYLDAVSIHPYRYDSAPEGIELQVAALQSLMAKYGSSKPIWVTEIGWGTHAPAAPGDLNLDETTQAKFLVRALVLLASAGVRQIYWYQFRDDPAEVYMGLVKNDAASTAKRSFTAMATLNSQLRSASFVARDQSADGVYSMHFNAGGELHVLWALTPTTISVPAGTHVTDLFGAAVSTSSGSFTATDAPVFIAGSLPGMSGTAALTASAVTDSTSAFSLRQGSYGWYYGYFLGATTTFHPLATTRTTDWKEEWTDTFPFISITETDQHPSISSGQQIAVVRRWISTVTGNVRLTAHFKVGTQGDGVRVRVLADGSAIYSATLGGGASIAGDFTTSRAVQVGSIFDFAVDPGAAGNIDYDATQVSVTFERSN